MKNLLKLFVNPLPERGTRVKVPEAYRTQVEYLKQVWREETYGLERLARLGLCFAQFFFPVLLIRDLFSGSGVLGRRLAVEAYALAKLIFPLLALFFGWYNSSLVVFLVLYFLADTLVHILHLIFLADIHSAAVSYRRSLILIFLHYFEVASDFAVIYLAFDLLNRPMDALSALYFSVVATTTVGFGDICAKNSAGQLAVMAQLAICVVFIILFINYFSQKTTDKQP